MIKHILMPTDGSKCSEQAIVEGLDLAKALGAEVTFLYAVEDPITTLYAMPGAVTYQTALWDDLVKFAKDALQRAKTLASNAGVKATTTLIEHQAPAVAIREAEKDYDMVIMGTHGRHGFKRLMLGSVAEGVLRSATKPYLMIRHPNDSG